MARKISNKNDRNQVADQRFSLNSGSLRALIVKVSKNWFCPYKVLQLGRKALDLCRLVAPLLAANKIKLLQIK